MRQRRALDVNACPAKYLHLPIERQMIGMLGYQDVGDDHLVVYERTTVKTARIDWGPHLTSFFLFPCKISSPPSTRERRGSGRSHNAIRCRSGADLGRQIRRFAPPPHVSVGKHWHFA